MQIRRRNTGIVKYFYAAVIRGRGILFIFSPYFRLNISQAILLFLGLCFIISKRGEEAMKKWNIMIGAFLCSALLVSIHCKSPETSEVDVPYMTGQSETGSNSQAGSGGSGDSSGGSISALGTLVVKMKDKPVEDADQVWVTISSIKVHYADNDEWFELFNGSFDYDLLELKDNPATLDKSLLPAGHYNQIRVEVTEGWIVFLEDDGQGGFVEANYDLKIPSGKIKIPVQFHIEEDGMTLLILDFDAAESIKVTKRGNKDSYILHPVIKVEGVSFGNPEY